MKRIAILGASGYTGAELVRLIAGHPGMRVAALAADRKAGGAMAEVFPHLAHLDLPPLVRIEEVDFGSADLVFCALPHGVTQELAQGPLAASKIVDLSADFRLRDVAEYERWYGEPHRAPELQREAAFGIPEFHREAIAGARITANSGCYVATALLATLPLVEAGVIDPDDMVIDAASGVSGAGRALKEPSLFAEASEGFSAYGVGGHRHVAELEQEISRVAGRPVICAFTPHLLPQVRGILATIYVKGDPADVHGALTQRHASETFVHVLPFGRTPATRHVRGSNFCHIGVAKDRRPGRAIVIAALDNLVKGASGQALQCANLMLGLPEAQGLEAPALFP